MALQQQGRSLRNTCLGGGVRVARSHSPQPPRGRELQGPRMARSGGHRPSWTEGTGQEAHSSGPAPRQLPRCALLLRPGGGEPGTSKAPAPLSVGSAGLPASVHLSSRTRHLLTQQVYKPDPPMGLKACHTACVFRQDSCHHAACPTQNAEFHKIKPGSEAAAPWI